MLFSQPFSITRILIHYSIGEDIALREVTKSLKAFCNTTWPDLTDADVVNGALEQEQPDLVRLIKKLEIVCTSRLQRACSPRSRIDNSHRRMTHQGSNRCSKPSMRALAPASKTLRNAISRLQS